MSRPTHSLPNFLVLGPPRAATTWLFKCAEDHPDIFVPDVKQVHFFDKNYDKGVDWYARFFHPAGNRKAVGEFTPDYFPLAEGPQRILQTLGPSVRLFAILRDPVERAFSEYLLCLRENWCDCGFIEALKRIDLLVGNGLHARNLHRYLECFPAENITLLPFNELEEDPSLFLRRFLDGLGLSMDHLPPNLDKVVNADAPDPKHKGLMQAGSRLRRALDGSHIGRRLVWLLRDSGLVMLWHRFTAGKATYELSEELYNQALPFFRDDMAMLERDFGIRVETAGTKTRFHLPAAGIKPKAGDSVQPPEDHEE